MSSLAQDGSVQENGDHAAASRRRRSESHASEPVTMDGEGHETLELRTAVLARAIEHEIIPRLMLAHRNPQEHECLTLAALGGRHVSPRDVQDFAKLILSRDEDLARACIGTMRTRGISVESIYLDLLAPVARYLGELWEQDLCDFTEVTVGLGRLQQVLRELSPAFGQSVDHPANGRRILLLPAPGEQHTFGLVMVAEFFRRAGWDVAGGPWNADADPVTMARREWFDVIGFSVAVELHVASLAACVEQVRKASANPQVGIMIGGPVFVVNPEHGERLGADLVLHDGRQAPVQAEQMLARFARRT